MKIALLGAGQLGASLALALRESGAPVHITAYDALPAHAESLQAQGIIDRVAASPEDAVRGAEIIMLAAPLRSYDALARAIAPALPPHAIVTDVGSVKESMARLAGILPAARLVPGHPIAGSEKSGPQAGRGDLFRGRLCVLTPGEPTAPESVQAVESFWQLTGAEVIAMPVAMHDQIYAHVSHLPHLIAFVAASFLHELGAAADTPTLQRFLRIGRSNARMWTDVFLENRAALLPALAAYMALLEHFAGELRHGKPEEIGNEAAAAKTLLPRILAGSLISTVSLYEQQSGTDLRPFGAGGMRDIAAPAAEAPEGDLEAISKQSATVAGLIERILPRFREFETMIGGEDEPKLFAALTRMSDEAAALMNPAN